MTTNFLLSALSAEDRTQLEPHLQLVELEKGEVLYEPEDRIIYVWFPLTCLVSVMSVLLDGTRVESAIFGRESAAGLIEACAGGLAHSLYVIQSGGAALRLPAVRYQEAFKRSHALRLAVGQHTELLLTEARQEIACRTAHKVRPRLARFLLHCCDKSGSNEVLITHELLAVMVGTDRSTVSVKAAELKREGAITYARGRLRVVSPSKLEDIACECYEAMRRFRAQMGQPGGDPPE